MKESILEESVNIPMTSEKLSMKNSTPKCEWCGKEKTEKIVKLGSKEIRLWLYTCKCKENNENFERRKINGEILKNKIRDLKKTNIGERFKNKNFSNFNQKFNSKAFAICLSYVRNIEENLKNGNGLFLTGSVGTGKTHLIAGMIDYLARIKKIGVVYYTSISLLSEIRYCIERKEGIRDIVDKFKKTNLLIIDDLGAEKITDWATEILFDIIDYRYANLKSTIFATNLTDEEIRERLGERIMSRIYEMCKGVKMEGIDYRIYGR